MADKWQALYNFWSSFNVPAYEENSVPDLDEVTFPYITYEAVSATWDSDYVGNASIWTRDTSWAAADELANAIETALKDGGQIISYTGGMIWITAESPFAQSMGDDTDDRIKRKILTVQYHFS